MEIGGSLLASFLVCQRQAWLSYHGIEGDHDNDFLREGTYIHEEAYKRNKNSQTIGGSNIDTTKTKEGKLIIGEVKKSSHCIEAARMQLAYYLYELKEVGVEATGVLQFPQEKKTEEVVLTKELEEELKTYLEKLQEMFQIALPPKAIWKKYCETCSYCESCWA